VTARVGVVGATGYAGSECVRWLLGHPEVEVEAVVSRRAGTRLGDAIPSLFGLTDLVIEEFDAARLARLDAVFLATPHGAAADLARALDASGAPLVIDLAADHRLDPGWTYGQPEWNAEAIRGARRIAAPGCFATAIEMAAAPLVRAKAVKGPLFVSAATGSTGSGASPSEATHHPERFANLRAYKVLSHQHVPEVKALLARVGGGAAPDLHFVPLSAPLDRGILATVFATVDEGLDVGALFAEAYRGKPLVRVRDGSPEVRHVRGTALADVAAFRDGSAAVGLCALDNLGKGAASQAVQCLNLRLGLPVETGLLAVPCTP
jgi:N-acetyl-gamma-glutamyl-phosphate reductase